MNGAVDPAYGEMAALVRVEDLRQRACGCNGLLECLEAKRCVERVGKPGIRIKGQAVNAAA